MKIRILDYDTNETLASFNSDSPILQGEYYHIDMGPARYEIMARSLNIEPFEFRIWVGYSGPIEQVLT